jgi:dUTP pyrophosphatase
MAKFEKVSKYANVDIQMPCRKTTDAAGYDMVAAEDIIIPPYNYLMNEIVSFVGIDKIDDPVTLDEMAKITKSAQAKPTLIPTGMKCQLEPNTYLELSVRSSCPLKHWLMMANSVGIIDADYYNNPDNEGHIFFQIYNMSPIPIIIKKGEAIGQGIIKNYIKTEDDVPGGTRVGGFGSSDQKAQ